MKPYFDHDGHTIYQGHVLDVLKNLPDESVQMCITSPPYWGLRDYGTDPIIWDDPGDCEHVWGELMPPRGKSGWHTFEKKYHNPGSHKTTLGAKMKDIPEDNPGHGNFCQHCGAWRGSLGLEPTPELFVKHITDIFREVRRVLKPDGVLWLNMGDSYASGGNGGHRKGEYFHGHTKRGGDFAGNPKKPPPGLKPKDLVGIPWMCAFALRSDGWYLRSDIIWNKPNPMPESVTDRPTKAHEYLFLLTKNQRYYYDAEAIKEDGAEYEIERRKKELKKGLNTDIKIADPPGQPPQSKTGAVKNLRARQELAIKGKRNKRTVWTVATQPNPEAHFATFPEKLIEPCILAGSKINDIVCDPFGGSGTSAKVAKRLNRKSILIELNPEYAKMPVKKLNQKTLF
jgi:DNA modification methylase